jgi:predicted small secreted protein
MSKRWLIAMVTALSLILAACANDAEGGDTTTTAANETTTTADGGETTTTADEGGMETPYEHLNAAYAAS